jgi:hypothetical protein
VVVVDVDVVVVVVVAVGPARAVFARAIHNPAISVTERIFFIALPLIPSSTGGPTSWGRVSFEEPSLPSSPHRCR